MSAATAVKPWSELTRAEWEVACRQVLAQAKAAKPQPEPQPEPGGEGAAT